MNPLDIVKKFIMNGGSPQELLEKFMKTNSNPMIGNLIDLAKKGDIIAVQNFANNICKERGINFDEEFPKFKQMFNKR